MKKYLLTISVWYSSPQCQAFHGPVIVLVVLPLIHHFDPIWSVWLWLSNEVLFRILRIGKLARALRVVTMSNTLASLELLTKCLQSSLVTRQFFCRFLHSSLEGQKMKGDVMQLISGKKTSKEHSKNPFN